VPEPFPAAAPAEPGGGGCCGWCECWGMVEGNVPAGRLE